MRKINSYEYAQKKFCSHPRSRVVRYGGRRRKCLQCNRTFRIRRAKRGRKKKREKSNLATRVLRLNASLRGISELSGSAHDTVRMRFHRSLATWKRAHPPALPFDESDGKLILILDGIYFALEEVEYVCQMILVRPVECDVARLRGLILAKGEESREHWEEAFEKVLTPLEEAQICAVVADGSAGLVSLSNERGWAYQRCHFHLLKDLKNICGGHRGASRERRRKIVDCVRAILDTPDENETKRLVKSLKCLIAHPECPETVRRKMSGFLKHLHRFRTCYLYPELRLPKTSNTAECAGRLIRERIGYMHGVHTVKALEYWLDVILREHPEISCT